MHNKIPLWICGILALCALFAPVLAPSNYFTDALVANRLIPPFSPTHFLGTDEFGRDTLSGILYALRTSFFVCGGSCLLAMVSGSFLGLIAAYKGGIVDAFIRRVIELQMAVPSFLLALLFVGLWGQGKLPLFIALALTQWAYFAQAARAFAKSEVRKEYLLQAKMLPHSDFFIISRHLSLTCIPPLLPLFSIQFARGVGIEAALSFLGAGLPLTEPSFGLFIAQGYGHFLDQAYWLCLFPALVLMLLIITLTLCSDQLSAYFRGAS